MLEQDDLNEERSFVLSCVENTKRVISKNGICLWNNKNILFGSKNIFN
jgi:hypothetical protein